jgi:peptide chain release factor subunit 1
MATTNSMKLHKLRKLIAWLSDKEGKGMEFISIYIPAYSTVESIIANLKDEYESTITKYENTTKIRDHLQDALKNIIQRLKLQTKISDNGLAIFAGAFVINSSESKIVNVEEIVPPEPITTYLYEVNNHFRLEPLREMLRNQKIVGIVALDSKETSFGVLKGEHLEIVENITSGIHGKSGKGGSSQRRYERERNMALTNYFHRVAEHAAKIFLEKHKITALIVGGPGQTKEDFLNGDYLHYELKNVLVNTADTQSANSEGVREVLDKSSEILRNMCAPEERLIVQRLLTYVGKQDSLAIYGLDPVLNALKNGEVEVALVTDSTDMIEIFVMCNKCGLSRSKIVNKNFKIQAMQEMIFRPCERCSANEYTVDEKDIVDVLEDLASQSNSRVEVISTVSEEKEKLTALGGFAAILRYRIKMK